MVTYPIGLVNSLKIGQNRLFCNLVCFAHSLVLANLLSQPVDVALIHSGQKN